MKSGTTSLCRELGSHDEVFFTPAKETFYFSQHATRVSLAEYYEHFVGASTEKYVAEGSANYTARPFFEDTPYLLHDFNPNAKLVYIVRSPFSRAVSHYKHNVVKEKENNILEPPSKTTPSISGLVINAFQLRPYIELFGREAIYIDFFERYLTEPRNFLADLYSWLELDYEKDVYKSLESVNPNPNRVVHVNDSKFWVRSLKRARNYARKRSIPIDNFAYMVKMKLLPQRVMEFDTPEFETTLQCCQRSYSSLMHDWITSFEELTGLDSSEYWND